MEEKKITEQESLDIITRMIEQTKQESSIGSGNMFLMWGYLSAIVSLGVFVLMKLYPTVSWGLLFTAIIVVGFIATLIMQRKERKNKNAITTYSTNSINGVWQCISLVFAICFIYCSCDKESQTVWNGMFLLGLLLPGIGTYCTGKTLKEWKLQLCGIIGMFSGLDFLEELCKGVQYITPEWCLEMAITMVIALVIPGHILNRKARKTRKKIESCKS